MRLLSDSKWKTFKSENSSHALAVRKYGTGQKFGQTKFGQVCQTGRTLNWQGAWSKPGESREDLLSKTAGHIFTQVYQISCETVAYFFSKTLNTCSLIIYTTKCCHLLNVLSSCYNNYSIKQSSLLTAPTVGSTITRWWSLDIWMFLTSSTLTRDAHLIWFAKRLNYTSTCLTQHGGFLCPVQLSPPDSGDITRNNFWLYHQMSKCFQSERVLTTH